jgi:hypothetical protein
MWHVTWTISTTAGPVIGEATADTQEAAWLAVRDALASALGKSFGQLHRDALAAMQRRAALAFQDAQRAGFEHRSASVVVTLTRTGPTSILRLHD